MSCHKRAFTSKRNAREQAQIWRKKLRHKLRPYECPYCGLWHLTSQMPRQS